MSVSVPPASNNISESIAKLRHLSRVEVQSGWRYSDCDSAVDYVNICNWQVAELNDKGHIAWPSGKQVLHLGQHFLIPNTLCGYPVTGLRLLLGLTWWAEDAQIFVNGELVGQGDLFDCSDRVLLTDSAIPGDEFLVILRLVSPGHDSGALVRSICLYESADSACLDPGFVADELEILQNFLTRNLAKLKFPYSSTEIVAHQGFIVKRETLKSEIAREVGLIDWSVLCDRQKFDLSLAVLRQNLLGCLRDVPRDLKDGTTESAESAEGRENHPVFVIGDGGEKLSTSIYIGEIYLLGHAHLDLAWLWPIEETWEAAERTFESVLKLQSEFPDLIFCHSTPALYAWIEEHRPDLFAAIKKQVAAGLWEVVGGLWVEPDLNLISAESMVRQVFYGQRYSQEKFGELMRVVWLPDTFGFGWQLPQILRAGGLDYFVTQKLRWNDTTEFPHSVFLWEGLDGTKIFSMMSAAIGEGIESVKMANYTFDWQFKTGLQSAFWLPGVGDHGGGPTRDMLEVMKRWEMSPFFPSLQFAKAVDYLSLIESQFLPEISESESQGAAVTWENQPILKQDEVVGNLSAVESPKFTEISDSESAGAAVNWKNQPILKLDEVVENLSAVESPKFTEISDSESAGAAVTWKNQPILKQDEVVENLSAVESPKFTEISESESAGAAVNQENQPILKQDEVVENLSAVESPKFNEISDSESAGAAVTWKNQPILKLDEVVENLSAVEAKNFNEISDSESAGAAVTWENQPILKQDEVVENLSAVESPKFTEISESESAGAAVNQENKPILKQDEVVENLSAVEAKNFNEISDSESAGAAVTWKNQPILKLDEVVENLSAVEAKNFNEISDSESAGAAVTWKNQPILKLDEVVENLSAVEAKNFNEISDSESAGAAVTWKNQPILKQDEVVENLSAVEAKNFNKISDSESAGAAVTWKNQPILKQDEVVENLSAVEAKNFNKISDSESAGAAVTWKNQPILKQDEVVENLSAVEAKNFNEISDSESAGAAVTWKNQPILKQDEVVENLSAVEAKNFNEISDFKTILPPLPIWKDELYLEFHRGCYTTRADQKRQNRRCEELLYQAELLSSLARICAGAIYPSSELETAWKKVLFNQFHDILPGSAIAQVYVDTNLAFAEVDRTCRQIMLKSLDAIALQISLPSPPQPDAQPILIFNTLNWSRSQVVSLPLPDSAAENWLVYDLLGQRLVTQIQVCDRPEPQFTLLFSANNIPAVGYRVFWLCREAAETPENSSLLPINYKKTELRQVTTTMARNEAFCQETHFEAQRKVLENEFFLAKIDWETGNLSSIWDKLNNREVLNVAGGNQLQSFQDSGQYWDAWNIDPNYEKHQLPAPILKDISWIAQGEIRQSLRVVRQIGKSEFCQDYIVEIGSPLLKIRTLVDWQETHVLVKTAFGLNQSADFATCEIPGGAIERTTKPQTATEKAKWEVPILRWVDISNDDFGVSLLNDCKYGCDLQPNQLRLTLLRGSTWPDEQADIGIHEFTYAVYPHRGNWQNAGTVRQGYELNLPLLVKVLPKLEENHNKTLPTVGKLLDLSADNLVLMAFKQSEDNPNLWILRCYESEGKEAVLELDSDLGLAISQPVDLLERPANLSEKLPTGGFKIEPWKIASFAVNL